MNVTMPYPYSPITTWFISSSNTTLTGTLHPIKQWNNHGQCHFIKCQTSAENGSKMPCIAYSLVTTCQHSTFLTGNVHPIKQCNNYRKCHIIKCQASAENGNKLPLLTGHYLRLEWAMGGLKQIPVYWCQISGKETQMLWTQILMMKR